jgi:hypothetical protein
MNTRPRCSAAHKTNIWSVPKRLRKEMHDVYSSLWEEFFPSSASPSTVVARCSIEQSPFSDAPRVPRGTEGYVEDVLADSDGLLAVDFGDPYGVVLCSPEEVK